MTAPALYKAIQGGTPPSADNLNTYAQTCDNVNQLRAFIGVTGIQVYIRGYSNPNDGGQGFFYWNATGTASDDGGVTTVKPSGAAVGVWTRLEGISGLTSTLNGISTTNVNVDIVSGVGTQIVPNVSTRQIAVNNTGLVSINSVAPASGGNFSVTGSGAVSVTSITNGINIAFTGSGTGDMVGSSNLVVGAGGITNASTARTNLGLAIGTNVQAYSAQLDSAAALASNGIVARTAANTFTARTIAAGSGKLSVTNGDGVSGNPTIDIGTLPLNDLSDVVITSATTGQVVLYNGTNWVNGSAGALSIALNDLTDVVITSPTNGETITFDGTNWVNSAGSGSINTALDYTWTGNNTWNAASGKQTTWSNPNYSPTITRGQGWWSDSASPGNNNFMAGRLLVGEAILNAGSQTASTGGEWVEALSNATVRLAQFASVNRTSGIGVLGASRTSDFNQVGSMGTMGLMGLANNDNTTATAMAVYGGYFEAYQQSTAASVSTGYTHGIEIAVINLGATPSSGLATNPYNPNAAGLVDGLRIGCGKPGLSGQECSHALAIINAEGTSAAKFRRGLIIASDAISAGSDGQFRAINLAQQHSLSWWVDASNVGPMIRSDVNTAGTGLRQIFANNGFYLQDPTGSNNLFYVLNSASVGTMYLNGNALDYHAMKFFSCVAYRNSSLSISDSTATALPMQVELSDDFNGWDSGTPTRITVPAGVTRVKLEASVGWDANGTGYRAVTIRKNGAGYPAQGQQILPSVTGIGFTSQASTPPLPVTGGDYFEIFVTQNSGGPLNVTGNNQTWFAMTILK